MPVIEESQRNAGQDVPAEIRFASGREHLRVGDCRLATHELARAIRRAVLDRPSILPDAQELLAEVRRLNRRYAAAGALLRSAILHYMAQRRSQDARRARMTLEEILLDQSDHQGAGRVLAVMDEADDVLLLRGRQAVPCGAIDEAEGILARLNQRLGSGPPRHVRCDVALLRAEVALARGEIDRAWEWLSLGSHLSARIWCVYRMERAQRLVTRIGSPALPT
jgi:hypothetical protein